MKDDKAFTAAEVAAAAVSAVISTDIKYIKDEISEIKQKLDCQFVTQAEFKPVKAVVYGLVGIILVAVVTALLALVVLRR